MFNIQEELERVPEKPGVYIMRDSKNSALYVGKAIVLKKRLRSYFRRTPHNERITQMISKIDHFEYIVTDNEYEALLLECNLIKKYSPKYNVLLKDDKTYPYIKITMGEQFPRVMLARRVEKGKDRYFGPYFSAWTVNTILDALRKIFPLRTCRKNVTEETEDRVCLNYHIGLCSGACGGRITKEEYASLISDVCDFLSGKTDDLLEKLKSDMLSAAERLDFELAAIFRERIKALENIREKQKIALLSEEDFDVLALAKNDIDACLQIFFVRGGKVIGRDFYIFEGMGDVEDSEITASFIKQFYKENAFIPNRIYSGCELASGEKPLLEEWLTEIRGRKCEILIPRKGDKKKLALMVEQNARIALANHALAKKNEYGSDLKILENLADILELDRLPMRIEAYDISNTGDSDINASMVVFKGGKPCKKEYKLYKMKTVASRNDVASMAEVISRRFMRFVNCERGFEELPDLLLVDGGLGQVCAARGALRELHLDSRIPVFGMVKDNRHKTRGLVSEAGEFQLNRDLELWRFISNIQNEAHRFAVEYNRKLTEKRYKKSLLDDIPGIGKKRKLALLRHFGSLSALKKAGEEELLNVKSMNRTAAKAALDKFKETGADE